MLPNSLSTSTRIQYLYKLYKPLLILMLICGFNLVFKQSLCSKITSRIYTISILIIISYANMTCCPSQEISFIWSLLEYAVYILIMMFYKSCLPAYMQKAVCIDTYLRVNMRHYKNVRSKIIIFILSMCVIRSGYLTAFCLLHPCYTSLTLFFIYQFSMIALDIIRVWRYMIFEEIWRRLRLLRKRMEEFPEEDFYLYVKNNKTVKENKIKFGLYLYKNIADLLDMISPELNASLFMGVVCSLPKLIVNVYRILLVLDKKHQYDSLAVFLFHIFQTTVFIFIPCVVVEMYQAEVEKIKLFLMHKLIYETDPETKENIQLFLQYTTVRTFRYQIWRMIPLDLSLPLQLMHLCTTYVIVIINFTKVFD